MNYRIRRYFSVVAHSPDMAEIRYGVWNPTSCTLRDESSSGTLTRLLLRLDGTSSVSEIAESERVATHEVEQLLERLNELGMLENAATNALDFVLERTPGAKGGNVEPPDRPMPVAIMGDAELAGAIAGLLRGSLPDLPVVLPPETADPHALQSIADPDDDALAFQAELLLFEDWRNHLLIVVQRVVDPELAHRINRICLALRTPWLHAALDGPFLFVGPLTVPNRSACFDCFETRVMMNLRESANYQRYKRAVVERLVRVGTVPVEPVLRNLLAGHTAIEALNYLLTEHSCLIGKVLSIYLPTMEFTYHDVLRLPNCRSCTPQSATMRRELYFDAAAVTEPAR
jgi:bacteriocin biosynthesis cyclodehydratase domain-containing protein